MISVDARLRLPHSCQRRIPVLVCKEMNQFLPDFFRVEQKVHAPGLGDVETATRLALAKLPLAKFVRRGMKVAVGAGSRGISNYASIVRVVCQELKKL